jgi:hypothetical protein
MIMRALVTLLVAVGIVGSLGAGCSNTELNSSWMSKEFHGPKFTSFVVLGVSRDATLRRVAEDSFVNQLAARGVRAVPSYHIFPSDPEALTREQVEEVVKRQDVDGVIVARVSKVEKETRAGGSFATVAGAGGFVGHSPQGWSSSYYSGGTAYQFDVVSVEVQLYDLKTNQMVWSAQTSTYDPSDVGSSTRDWAKVVIDALVKRRII